MELNIFHLDTFERVGIVDEFQLLEITTNYKKHSDLELLVSATAENIDYFITKNDDIFLTAGIGKVRGYLIESVKYTDEKKTTLEVYCKSLSAMLGWRQIDVQQTFRGNVEEVIRSFVNTNAIAPTNINRKIDNLFLGSLFGITDTTEESYSNKDLDESLWEICVKFDIAYEIFADITNKRFEFVVWKGTDRSTNQTIRDAVIFSKEFDNVLSQHYTDDKSEYRNTVIIAGEGDGVARTYLVVGNENKGRKRREMFVDARDLQSSEADQTKMSQTAYEALLIERAKNKQAEYERVQSFETDIVYDSQFTFGSDYFMGDLITIRNDEISVALHTRIVTTKEKYSPKGYELSTEFGSNVPTLLNKIKKAVK
ncbi:siphovirus ReqiPepy6 Gp37-like family protein [Kurthia sp. YJT4]|uniref:siphovirus ReqiPepy6 Gp37-like family protein n=1 Tax=Kurthia sp. YJT4 TaxID=3049086 RepID=UPI0025507FB2|nr:siphovirus ReqiPepy6 Gp37-like family protein [Kurthia sp. YJT4]WIL39753.1 siphovirus ReqiPepy6 Gp37-like family protein [Kurthia sp. YJT4]